MQLSAPPTNKNTADDQILSSGENYETPSSVPLNNNITAEKDDKIQSSAFTNKNVAAGGGNMQPLAPQTNKTVPTGKDASSAPLTNRDLAVRKVDKARQLVKDTAEGEGVQPSVSGGRLCFSPHPLAESENSPRVFGKSHDGYVISNGIVKQRRDPDDEVESDAGAEQNEMTDEDIDGGVAVVWALTGLALALALIWVGKELKRLWDLRVEMMLRYPEGPPPS